MTLQEAAALAPLVTASMATITAVIAATAAGIAWRSIHAQRDIARRRAAIDFFLKTEMDTKAIELYEKFKKIAPTIRSMPSLATFVGTKDYDEIRAFLNICELIAVGINEGSFSENVSYSYWGDVLPRSYRDAEPLINHVRKIPGEGTRYTYVDLERIAVAWTERAAKAAS